MTREEAEQKKRSIFSRLVRIVVISSILVMIVVGGIVAFAPRLAGTRMGLALINRLINTNPQMKVEIRDIDLRWSGTQRMPSIHIDKDSGAVVADLSVELTGSLWEWGISGSRNFGTIIVGGRVDIDEAKLNAGAVNSVGNGGGANTATGNITLPLNLAGDLQLKDVVVSYHPNKSVVSAVQGIVLGAGPVEVKNLTGTVGLVTDKQGGKVSWKFVADTEVSGSPGHITSTGKVTDFVNGVTGVVDAENTKCEMVLESTAVPVAIVDALTDSAGRLTALFGGKANINTKLAGSFDGGGTAEISINSPSAEVRLAATINHDAIIIKEGGSAQFTLEKGALSSFANDEAVRTQLASSGGMIDFQIHQLRIPLHDDRSIKYDGSAVDAELHAELDSIEMNEDGYDSLALSNFTMTVKSENIINDITVLVNGKTDLSNSETKAISSIPFDGKLSLHKAVTNTGYFDPNNQTVSAEITANNIDSALLDEMTGLDHWVRDSAGAVIDRVHLAIRPGEAGEDPMSIIVEADSAWTRVRFKGRLDDNHGVTVVADKGDEPQLVLKVGYALGKRITTAFSTTDDDSDNSAEMIVHPPGRIAVEINNFNLPVIAPMNNLSDMKAVREAMRSLSVDAIITMNGGEVTFPASYLSNNVNDDMDKVWLDSTAVHISTNKLSNDLEAQIQSTGALDSANNKPFTIRIPVQITSPLDETARRITSELFVDQFLGSTISTRFTMQEGKTGCNISANGEMDLTPALAQRFLAEKEGVTLLKKCKLKFTVRPFHLGRMKGVGGSENGDAGAIAWDGITQSAAVEVHLEVNRLTAQDAGDLKHAVDVRGAVIDATWLAGVRGLPRRLRASATVFDADTNQKLAVVNAVRDAAEEDTDGGVGNLMRVDLNDIDIAGLETMLGYEPNSLSDLTGDRGEVTVEADLDTLMNAAKGRPNERAFRIVGKFPRFTTDISARINERADRIVIDPGGVIRFAVKHETAERMLAGMYETEGKSANHILVNDDIQISLNIREASIDADAFSAKVGKEEGGGGLTPDAIALDAELLLSPFQLQAAQNEQVFDQFTLRDVRVALQTKDGSEAIGFGVSGLVRNRTESPELFLKLVLGVNDAPDENAHAGNEAEDFVNALLGQSSGNGNNDNDNTNTEKTNGQGAVAKTPAEINPDGEIRIAGTVTGIFSASGESTPGGTWVIRNLSGNVDHLPVPFLDVLADSSGAFTAAMGSSLSADIEAKEFGPGRGAISMSMTSSSGRLHIQSAEYLSDGTIRLGTGPVKGTPWMTGSEDGTGLPMVASLDLTPDMAHVILDKVSPMFYDIRKKNGPITLNVRYLRLPTDGDLAKLDGDFVLDLGQVDMSTGGFFGDILGTAKKNVDELTTATLQPIPIRIRQGIVKYKKFKVQAANFKVTTGGSINLITQNLDLTAAVPLIGWQSTFGQLTGALNGPVTDWDIPFYLVIRGTIDDPKIKPDPKGAQRVAKEMFKRTVDDTVGNIFNQLLNNNKDKNKKKNGGGKNGGGG